MAKKVIIVDDSRAVIASVEMALEPMIESGLIELKTCMNPAEILKNLQDANENFDMLLCDINMPQMNGLEFAAEVKKIPLIKTKPIIMLTTESSAEIKQAGKNIGVAGWIVKPFSEEKIIKAIKMVLAI